MPTLGKPGKVDDIERTKKGRESYTLKNKLLHSDTGRLTINVALVGNPNCGKSTLFNCLTKSHQHVGNWPGVTVEKKEGFLEYGETKINITDLPGAYSLSPCSFEEIITRNYLLENKIDVIVNVLDATNLKRNLYLTTQLLEFNKPVILALNMLDILKEENIEINFKKLEQTLKVPVIPISASKEINLKCLIESVINYKNIEVYHKKIYTEDILTAISNIEKILIKHNVPLNKEFLSWASVKLFGDDALIGHKLNLSKIANKEIEKQKDSVCLEKNNIDRQTLIAIQRYDYLNKVCEQVITKKENKKAKFTEKLDNILLNRFFALPLFFLIMAFIFFVTFGSFGTFLKELIYSVICKDFGSMTYNFLHNLGASGWSKCLVKDGIIEGVGAVVSFLPQIIILFISLSFLEDSGYMARAAFIMDKPLKLLGLSGKAFVPLLMGFGCSVPAVLGTRILEKNEDKKRTIFMIPFMSCGAKMPIYAMFISIFFSEHQVFYIFSIYLLGIIVAIITALLLKGSSKDTSETSFIMELPNYKLPTFKSILYHVWEKIKDFLEKAGTVLLGASIIIWFLQSFSFNLQMVTDNKESILAKIGAHIAPIFSLCGFNDWRASVSLLCGIVAKESVVSTMAILYNAGGASLNNLIAQNFSKASAYSFMTFALLCTPCIAALSAIKKELASRKLFIIYIIYQLVVAWGISALVFQIGKVFFCG